MWIFRSTKFPLDASNNLSASQLFPPRWSRFDTETKTKKQYEWWRSEQAGRKQEEAVSLCSRWGMRKRSCSVSNCSEGGQGTFSQRGKARRRPSTHTRCIFLHRWEKHKGGRTATADRWKSVTFFVYTLLSWGTDQTIFHLICCCSGTAGRWGLARAPSDYLCGPLRGHCTSCDACGDAGKVTEVYEWRDSPGGI